MGSTQTPQVRPWTTRIANFIPSWLARRPSFQTGFKFLWTVAFWCDVGIESALQLMRAGWPGYDGRTDNFALLGQSRQLLLGESEAAPSFGLRLRYWLLSAQDMGGDAGLAFQLHFWLGNAPRVRIWSRNGRCTTVCQGSFTVANGSTSVTATDSQDGILEVGNTVTFQPGPPTAYTIDTVSGTAIALTEPYTGPSTTYSACCTQISGVLGGWSGPGALSGYGLNWDSISNPERAEWWWESWIVIYPDDFGSAGTLGDRSTGFNSPTAEQAGTGEVYGIGHLCTRLQHDTIRGLVAIWKGQHATIRWIIWTSNGALFDPLNPGESGNPLGTWGSWSYLTTIGGVTSKFCGLNTSCRFWKAQN